ncbi:MULTISPECIES: hypothetical protein [Streptomyces]|uniref:Uncharacterized protein n=2 Tax=Streptomyces TaxID=1883 RepID=A0ABV9IUG5_9ACTN
MPELSFPFDADNTDGGSKVVSQTQWQAMAANWGGDRVDYALTNTSYTAAALPFAPTISGRNITLSDGSAWVGGFYYKLSGTKTLAIASNSSTKARKDLVILRADMAKSAVNMVVLQGTGATTPVAPPLTRTPGGVWEMALHEVEVPANGGSIVTVSRRAPHPVPGSVSYPWNQGDSAALMPRGTFSYDLDSNGGGVQLEAYNGRDGWVRTRDFGKSRTYTPSTLYVSALPAANRRGRWRWVSPNVFWFSITVVNDFEDQGAGVTGSNTVAAVTLPAACNPRMFQTTHGMLRNPYESGGLPNAMAITGVTQPGTSTLYLYTQNYNTLSQGLDGLRQFPARSTFLITGSFEANEFNE